MEKLAFMLKKRYHKIDIINYIKENYYEIVKNRKIDFLISMFYPERLKPRRYYSLIPTKVFHKSETINVNKCELTVKYDLLFEHGNENGSILIDNKSINNLSVHPNIIKMYRITAFGIYINNEFTMNNIYYEGNKKIVYIPYNENNLNFKFINSTDNKQNIILNILNDNTKVKFIAHIEYIPLKNEMFNTRKFSREMNIFEDVIKYKSLMITDYNVE